MSYFKSASLLFLLFVITSCGSDDDVTAQNTEWLIESSEVFDGGPGKDGIPSVDSPNFSDPEEIIFLSNNNLVIGLVVNGEARAYPHKILDWHEIVNDELQGENIAITYCPLTGTAIGWDRLVNGEITEFGVSGKLYNANLMPYDRKTDSYWSQIGLNCVNGELVSTVINTHQLIETSWSTWKALYPDSKILNSETGFNRNYAQYPYGDYRTNDSRLIFPVNNLDTRRPGKERALAILEQNVSKAYSIESFETARLIEDVIGQKDIIVVGSKELNLMVAYENNLGIDELEFNSDNLPTIAIAPDGTQLQVDGRIVGGPFDGRQLNQTNSFIGYWFSLGAFYPDIELYE